MIHDDEYKTCCIKTNIDQQGGADGVSRKQLNRIQSAHSKLAYCRY
jgi:hypothetical protein